MQILYRDNEDIDVIFESEDLKTFSMTLRKGWAKAFKIYCNETDEHKVFKWWALYQQCLDLDQTVRVNEIALYGKPLEGQASIINKAYVIVKANHNIYFEQEQKSLYSSIPIMEEYVDLVNRLWKEKTEVNV